MRFLSVTLALGVGIAGCSRPESSLAADSGHSPSAAVRVEIAKDSPAPPDPPCLVATPDSGPDPAEPAAECPRDPEETPPDLPRGQVTFLGAADQPTIDVELAREPAQRNRGLMYRTSLPESQGMLFSWHDERPRSFWMRNTCIPLDMLFIGGDGTILGILEQVPVLNETSRTVPCPAAHVLEVNAGYCRRHGVRAGQKIRVDE